MVKFVRLPFHERSVVKRLSRTNPELHGYMPAPRIGGYMVTWLCVGVSVGVGED